MITDSSGDDAKDKLVILCASYFDELGHPTFAEKIAFALDSRFVGGVEVLGIATTERCLPGRGAMKAVPIKALGGGRFTLSSRSERHRRLGVFGVALSAAIRLITVTQFYWRALRRLDGHTRVIDLECDPIQAALAILLLGPRMRLKIGFVVHSMPTESLSMLMWVYKGLSTMALRLLVCRSERRVIFMNEAAMQSAIRRSIDRRKCILGGWGYDVLSSPLTSNIRPTCDDTVVLAFGVLRKDKRILELAEKFLELDAPDIQMKIVGKSIDVDVEEIDRMINRSVSRTKVSVENRYIEEDDIAALYSGCHVVVLSHSAEFESMSGPMFLALQYQRPILCFSGHTVASLVNEAKAGLVLRLEDDPVEILAAVRRLRDWRYDSRSLELYTWEAIASRMVGW